MSEFSDTHWLKFDTERRIVGCQCGFRADAEYDCGWGDSVVEHLRVEAREDVALEIEAARPHIPPSTHPHRERNLAARLAYNNAACIARKVTR